MLLSSVTEVINKLKKVPQDRLSQLVVVVLLIYIASILANLSYLMMPGSHTANSITAPNRAAEKSRSNTTSSFDLNSLTRLNLFGDFVAQKDEPKQEVLEITSDIPETNLNLTLTATVSEDQNSGKGTAIIQSNNVQGTYGIDEKIDGTSAIVKQVFTDRVILQNGPRMETLMLDGVEYDKMNIARKIEDPNSYNTVKLNNNRPSDFAGTKVDRRDDPNLSRRLAQRQQELKRNPMKLYDLIRFSPVRKGGALAGYRLNPGKEPELFTQAGFRPNDLAVEVNGTPLNDIQAAMQVLKDFRSMTEANIVVEREGIRTEILFSLNADNNGAKEDNNQLREVPVEETRYESQEEPRYDNYEQHDEVVEQHDEAVEPPEAIDPPEVIEQNEQHNERRDDEGEPREDGDEPQYDKRMGGAGNSQGQATK